MEKTEKGKHSWELGEKDPHVVLKESQRVGSFVAAGQWGGPAKAGLQLTKLLTQPNG